MENLKKTVRIGIYIIIIVILWFFLHPPISKKLAAEIGMKNYKQWPQAPPMIITPNKKYYATIITSKGTMKVDLFASEVPITVNNFIFLAREHFYEGMRFYRIIKDFIVETGDPNETGRGGPGYKFPHEPIVGGYTRGTLAMGNIGYNTNGSKIFFVVNDFNWPKDYVIFGKIKGSDINSLNTLEAIAAISSTQNADGEHSWPNENCIIDSVTISELP